MTYDQLYEHIINYISQPLDDNRKACLILGAVMEFNLDCIDEDSFVCRSLGECFEQIVMWRTLNAQQYKDE